MFLIMSAAYVGQELESEFGKLPPSFLPLGNRRLFKHQTCLAPSGVQVYLSIPESYQVSPLDQAWLDENKIKVIQTPDGLSLGASLVAAINLSGHALNKPLHVLYGDTLYQRLPTGDDIVSVSSSSDSYNWAILTNDSDQWLNDDTPMRATESNRIIDGYFKFSQPRELIKSITQSEWQFIEGLNKYNQSIGLTPIESEGWLDFGHVNTYYHSKADFTTQRAFNELSINAKFIEKSSVKDKKIAAEANWFERLPFSLRGYIPQYLGTESQGGKISYRLEYLHLTALNELYVFSKLPSHSWQQILTSCIEFLSDCFKERPQEVQTANTLDILFGVKTKQRISEYCKSKGIRLTEQWSFNGHQAISLERILRDSENHLPNGESKLSVLHGDFCFSNILYDFRASKIKTIDPRGMLPDGKPTLYGDIRYDIAKLSHSILGLYDWIIAGYCDVDVNGHNIRLTIDEDNDHKDTQQAFIELIEKHFGLESRHLYAMQIQLFLSMLPLHADCPARQDALFANAFRLHRILQRLAQ
ncbi:capsular biosynthesis protein [Vibrio sp. S4M6]|uniref:capsular biosynthesis protein n=1 Tax=Vibrio sinus TaxID=2946865 RepID=UPI002029C44F|nr:capsular biosynthesis protein [Vibrio sinus]MCL9780360.1 capsular biosynthesis protein [Vibrio sinus]